MFVSFTRKSGQETPQPDADLTNPFLDWFDELRKRGAQQGFVIEELSVMEVYKYA